MDENEENANNNDREGNSGGFSIFLFLFLTLLVCGYFSLHSVKEGCIGLYWRGGALLDGYTEPGYHFKLPFLTKFENIEITIQTDVVTNIPCGTSGGVMIYFEKIEVVNRLKREYAHETVKKYGPYYDKPWIYDRIHHEINQFCSVHTLQEVYITKFDTLDEDLLKALQTVCDKYNTGIEIVTIRVTKPKIPPKVMENYLKVAQETTNLLVAQQHQLVLQKEAETAKNMALSNAQKEMQVAEIDAQKAASVAILNTKRDANVTAIRLEKELLEKKNEEEKAYIAQEAQAKRNALKEKSESELKLIALQTALKLKEGEKKMAEMDAQILLTKEKAKADAAAYKILKEAEANAKLLTPEYLRMQLYTNVANNTKVFFGDSIPKMFLPLQDYVKKEL